MVVAEQIELLRRRSHEGPWVFDSLDMLCALLAHRRFVELFVEQGGVQLLLGLPRWVGSVLVTARFSGCTRL